MYAWDLKGDKILRRAQLFKSDGLPEGGTVLPSIGKDRDLI